jgi:dihydrodipicolinate synthase/N-acetylneuraminate lyase
MSGAAAGSGSLARAFARLAPGRTLHGISAVLLPYTPEGRIDWAAFEAHAARTAAAGLDLAVNMDTGFVDLLADGERDAVLDATRRALGPGRPFYAGAFPGEAGARDLDAAVSAYHRACRAIEARGGIPVLVQCPALRPLPAADKARAYARILDGAARALAFELSPVFAPHGEIWDDETFERIVALPGLAGAKHSSLDRVTELRRLGARDRLRPEFRVYTGNDLAIDLVLYGSDYLLGLSTFAPAAFAARDRALSQGDVSFLARNDALQHLGNVGFRAPVPAYKHAAAQFLHVTGLLACDAIHPRAPRRPASDRVVLFDCALRLGLLDDPERAWAERVAPFVGG